MVEVLYAYIDNEDVEVSAQWAVSLVRKSAGGTSTVTPLAMPRDVGMAAHGLTLRGMCTTVGTITTTEERRGFNILNGWEWVPITESDRIWVPPSGIFGLHLPVAPPATAVISAGLHVAVHG
jgi:hypothetical protein